MYYWMMTKQPSAHDQWHARGSQYVDIHDILTLQPNALISEIWKQHMLCVHIHIPGSF